jgi:MscS family membrane protein
VDGVVETIGFRSTRVRNLDGHLVTVPNRTIGNATITNVSLRPNIRTLINIGITYSTSAEKVKQALAIVEEVYRKHPMTQDTLISFNKFGDFSLNIFVVHWWKSTVYKDYLAGMQEMNLQLKQRFDESGIEFAFPTQTLYLKQDSDWRLAQEPPGRS